VRVIFTHHVADDPARLAVRPAGDVAGFVASVENPAVDRFQSVANVGQGPAHDHAHRVIEIAGLHFVDDRDRSDFAGVFDVAVFVGRRFGGQEPVLSLMVWIHGGEGT